MSNTAHLGVTDLMYPSIADGAKIFISALDIAIAQDSGAPIATDRGDYIVLVSGNDLFDGGAGDDSITGATGNDTLLGNVGNDVILGNQGNDILYGNQGNDIIAGGQDNDVVTGGQGDDFLYGNMGDDQVYGNMGNDTIFAGAGNDLVFGGQGDDQIIGGLGNDTMYGNLGADRYIFGTGSGADIIMDFSFAEGDRLDLQGQSYTTGTWCGWRGSTDAQRRRNDPAVGREHLPGGVCRLGE